jgi:uncharacterized protein DUF6166
MISYHVDRTHEHAGDVVSLVRVMDGTTTPITPELSREVIDHSHGFEMGYKGSGPSQIALAIILDYLTIKGRGETPAPSRFRVISRTHSVYIQFRDEFIASASVLLRVDADRLDEWLAETVAALPQLRRSWWGPEAEEEHQPPGPADQYVIGVDYADQTGDALRKGGELDPRTETRLPAGDRDQP